MSEPCWWYWEELSGGGWSPVAATDQPTIKNGRVMSSGGPGAEIRFLHRVDEAHEALSLADLRAIYGAEAREAAGAPAAAASPQLAVEDLRETAIIAAAQGAAGIAEILALVAGDAPLGPGDLEEGDAVRQILETAKIAIELHGDYDDELGQAYGAICRALEGWA